MGGGWVGRTLRRVKKKCDNDHVLINNNPSIFFRVSNFKFMRRKLKRYSILRNDRILHALFFSLSAWYLKCIN